MSEGPHICLLFHTACGSSCSLQQLPPATNTPQHAFKECNKLPQATGTVNAATADALSPWVPPDLCFIPMCGLGLTMYLVKTPAPQDKASGGYPPKQSICLSLLRPKELEGGAGQRLLVSTRPLVVPEAGALPGTVSIPNGQTTHRGKQKSGSAQPTSTS